MFEISRWTGKKLLSNLPTGVFAIFGSYEAQCGIVNWLVGHQDVADDNDKTLGYLCFVRTKPGLTATPDLDYVAVIRNIVASECHEHVREGKEGTSLVVQKVSPTSNAR